MNTEVLDYQGWLEYFNTLRHRNNFVLEKDSTITAIDKGFCEITFYSTLERHGNLRDNVHGGVYASLADSTMGCACFTLGKGVVTLDLGGNYLRSVKAGETLVCKGYVKHNGNRTMVTTCEIYDADSNVVYVGHATFFVVERIGEKFNGEPPKP